MGWTSYHASHYKKNGDVDRKAECDAYFMEGLNAGYFKVIKSAMRGSTYYAAVQPIKRYGNEKDADGKRIEEDIPEEERQTFAAVFLTSVDRKDHFNFSYKDMDETMGPYEDKCPESILSLLSPTDSEYALNWRKRCREKIKKEKSPQSLKNLPIGAVIRFELNGKEIRLEKRAPAYQFKTAWWEALGKGGYYSKKRIPDQYEVVVTK